MKAGLRAAGADRQSGRKRKAKIKKNPQKTA